MSASKAEGLVVGFHLADPPPSLRDWMALFFFELVLSLVVVSVFTVLISWPTERTLSVAWSGNRIAAAGHSGCVGPDQPSDSELWRRAASHDSRAFGDLFERHADRVYNHCFRRTADWSLAEDLTSVVFLEAWRKRKQVRLHGESVLPWLLAVANNCLRNAERSRRRYNRLLAKLPKSDDPPALDAETSERIDDAQTMRRILVVVHQLGREDQEVMAVCDWSGLTYEEAATALAIPIGTVKSRLSRSHGRLRALMDSASDGAQQSSTDLRGGHS